MSIEPDGKDWTWVLDRPCPDCGFDASLVDRRDLGGRLRENTSQWRGLVDHPSAGARPHDGQWSPLEYACHVRDVFTVMLGRLELLLDEDDPTFPNWDQDATAVEQAYADQPPAAVIDELELAGAAVADGFDSVPVTAWHRTGTRSDGARFSVETLGKYLLHDPVHHVWDVEQGYAALR